MIPYPPERRTQQLGGQSSQRFPPRPTGGGSSSGFDSRQTGCHVSESADERVVVTETAETPRPLSARLHRPMERPRACQESMAEVAFFRRIEQTMEDAMGRLSKHLVQKISSLQDSRNDGHPHCEGIEARLSELRASIDGLSVRLTMNEAAEALKAKANTEQQVAAIVQRETAEVRRSQEDGFSSVLSEITTLRRELRDDGGSREAMSFAVKDMSTNIVKAVSSLLDRSCLDFSPVFDAIRHEGRCVQAGCAEKIDGLAAMIEASSESWRPSSSSRSSAPAHFEASGASIEASLNSLREGLANLDVKNELAAIRWYTEDLYNGALSFASKQDLRSLAESLRAEPRSSSSSGSRSSSGPQQQQPAPAAKCSLDMSKLLEEVVRLSTESSKEAILRHSDALKANFEPIGRQLERLQQLQQESGASVKFQLQQLPELVRSALLDDELKGRQAVTTSVLRELTQVHEDLSNKFQESFKEYGRIQKSDVDNIRRSTVEEVRTALDSGLQKSNSIFEASLGRLDQKLDVPSPLPKLQQVETSVEQLRTEVQKHFADQLEFFGKTCASLESAKSATPPPEVSAKDQLSEAIVSNLLTSMVVTPLSEQMQGLMHASTSRQPSKGFLQAAQQEQKELASQLDATLQSLVGGLSEIKSSLASATAASAEASPKPDLLAGLLEKSDMTLQKVSSLDWSAAVAKLAEVQSEVGQSASSELKSICGKLDQLLSQAPSATAPVVFDFSPVISKLDTITEQVTASSSAAVAAAAATAAAATPPAWLTTVPQSLDEILAKVQTPAPTPDLTPVLQKLDEFPVKAVLMSSLERLEASLNQVSAAVSSSAAPDSVPAALQQVIPGAYPAPPAGGEPAELVATVLAEVKELSAKVDLEPLVRQMSELSSKVGALSTQAAAASEFSPPAPPAPEAAAAAEIPSALLDAMGALADKVSQLGEVINQASSAQEQRLLGIAEKIECLLLQVPSQGSSPELTQILSVLQEVRTIMPGKEEITVVVQATGVIQQQLKDIDGKMAAAAASPEVSSSSLLKAIEESRSALIRQGELQGLESNQRIGDLSSNLSALSLMVQSDRPEWTKLISDSGFIKALMEVIKGDVNKLQHEVRGFGNFHQEVLWAVQEVRSDIAGSVMDLNSTWSRGFKELHTAVRFGEERTNIRAERCDRALSSTSKQVDKIQSIVAVMAKPPPPPPPLPSPSTEEKPPMPGKKGKGFLERLLKT